MEEVVQDVEQSIEDQAEVDRSGSPSPSPSTRRRTDTTTSQSFTTMAAVATLGKRKSNGLGDSLSPTRSLMNGDGPSRTDSRDSTPVGSPKRKRHRVYNDRFIPARSSGDMVSAYKLLHDEGSPAVREKPKKRIPNNDLDFQRSENSSSGRIFLEAQANKDYLAEQANRTYATLLRSELDLPTTIPDHRQEPYYARGGRGTTPPGGSMSILPPSLSPATPRKNLLSFASPKHLSAGSDPTSPQRTPSSRRSINLDPNSAIYSVSPIKYESQRLLLSPQKKLRTVSKVPYKVLDAPELTDDFYLNLVDWGSSNILGVGLGKCVYMWSAESGKVTKLCELPDHDSVTSVNWIQKGSHLAVGTHKGYVQIWDANAGRRLRTMTGHSSRVGALAWNEHILSSGSRDRSILHRDVRVPDQFIQKLQVHKQEVCGLRWNPDDGQLASGGNDNRLLVWDGMNTEPLWKFTDHQAAVKAIAWSPHQKGLLASGGGTADRKIRFWNTMTGTMVQEIDTGSQVCNLAWAKNSNELVSTHGYSQNQIVIWKYPSMRQVVSLTGHTYRVLYLAMSPDGEVIVTGAGDETLRFWNAFKKKEKVSLLGKFDMSNAIR